jgi:hypothetical protein
MRCCGTAAFSGSDARKSFGTNRTCAGKRVHLRVSRQTEKPERTHCNLAYSAFACLRIGMSGSASLSCTVLFRSAKNLLWHSLAAESNSLNSGVPRSFTSNGRIAGLHRHNSSVQWRFSASEERHPFDHNTTADRQRNTEAPRQPASASLFFAALSNWDVCWGSRQARSRSQPVGDSRT